MDQFLALHLLRPGSVIGINARKGEDDPAVIAGLAASILDKGIIQPLSVAVRTDPETGGDYWFVVAGNRRLKAMQHLMGEERITGQFLVPVIVRPESETLQDLIEVSLIENIERASMHPVDEYEAFADLSARGRSNKAIAACFRLKPKEVTQRLALGKLSPVILQAYRRGELSEDQVHAFTLADDQGEQAKVFDAFKGRHPGAWEIRRALTNGAEDRGRDIDFIGGVKEAKAAGVEFIEDLFENRKYVANPARLTELVQARYDAAAATILAEGWKWAENVNGMDGRHYGWRRLRPEPVWADEAEEKAWLDAVSARSRDLKEYSAEWHAAGQRIAAMIAVAKMRAITPEARAMSGVKMSRGDGMEINFEYGWVKPEDEPEVEDQGGDGEASAAAGIADPSKPDSQEPRAVVDVLRRQKTRAIADTIAMASNRQVSILLVAAMALEHGGGPVHIRARGDVDGEPLFSLPDTVQTFAEALAWIGELGDWQLSEAIASLVAMSVDATTGAMYDPMSGRHKSVRFSGIAALLDFLDPEVLDGAMHQAWDSLTYFTDCKKAGCLAAIREALGEEEVKLLSKAKAGDIAAHAAAVVPETGWLPVELRTAGYKAPVA